MNHGFTVVTVVITDKCMIIIMTMKIINTQNIIIIRNLSRNIKMIMITMNTEWYILDSTMKDITEVVTEVVTVVVMVVMVVTEVVEAVIKEVNI